MSSTNFRDLPSNEEIIEDLTNDLHDNLSVNNSEIPDSTSTKLTEPPEDFDHSDTEDSIIIDDDFIDEAALKDLEISLSEEQLIENHINALNYKAQGNEVFKCENYLESIRFYTQGLKICPLKFTEDRAVLYANRAASKAKLDRKQSAIDDCSKAIELNDKYVKAYLRRAKLYEESDKLDESLADFNKIIELDPGNSDAHSAQVRLPPLINEKNEKLKEEMLGKLKDLGNVILRPFGLSTENFKLTQDPSTGGYSVNFSQNSK
ncbi:unnamed protein product [Ceutorhynchus assimilis]|uniref:Tetratricopeptide repeat protein 1 n=1 Tax=Ceutorhynchus assimilis TaxID=467358 RepID=A0A9N9MXS2_9CUCU|nr:unnamed protein product [Ceutorhynchus assimilis]